LFTRQLRPLSMRLLLVGREEELAKLAGYKSLSNSDL
jgi:hypothetical protein